LLQEGYSSIAISDDELAQVRFPQDGIKSEFTMATPEGVELEAFSRREPAAEILNPEMPSLRRQKGKDLASIVATPEGVEPPTLSSED
jgi:hypothetical protein